MRFGSLVFLALFGAFVFRDRLPSLLDHPLHRLCGAALCEEPARAPAATARIRALQEEVDRLERRGRDLERSLQAVTQSARALRELAGRHGDPAVRAELAEIEEGRDRLAELRKRTEIERVTTAARLQLARAGALEPELDPPAERASPVDALSGSEARSVRASRAR